MRGTDEKYQSNYFFLTIDLATGLNASFVEGLAVTFVVVTFFLTVGSATAFTGAFATGLATTAFTGASFCYHYFTGRKM